MSQQPFYFYKPTIKRKINYIKIIILFILFGGVFYLIFFASFWRVLYVEVSGNQNVDKEVIILTAKSYFNTKTNILFLKTKILADALMKTYPAIENVAIKKHWQALTISVNERTPVALWCAKATSKNSEINSNCFYLDKNGIIFLPAPETSGSLILKISDSVQKNLVLGDRVIDPEILKYFLKFNDLLENKIGYQFNEFIINSDNSDFQGKISGAWRVLFNNQTPVEEEARILESVLSQEVKSNISRLDYIDLRFGKRIYYKLK